MKRIAEKWGLGEASQPLQPPVLWDQLDQFHSASFLPRQADQIGVVGTTKTSR